MKQDLPFAHLGILILLFLIAVNLLILDIKIFYPENFLFASIESPNTPDTPSVSPGYTAFTPYACPADCLNQIKEATSQARTGSAASPPDTQGSLPAVSSPREFFIPLGQGQTSKNDWDNLIGTETVINPSSYGTFLEAYLTYSLKNPTRNGQVEARLLNVTDNYAVFGSHIIMNGPAEQTITTGKFALPLSSKLYRIQLRSTLSFPASLENARLKIVAR